MGFLISNLNESMEFITAKLGESLNTQIVMGSVNFSLENLQANIVGMYKQRRKDLAAVVGEIVGNTTATIKDWLKLNAEVNFR